MHVFVSFCSYAEFEDTQCAKGNAEFFSCMSGQEMRCYSNRWQCDGIPDCNDRRDESPPVCKSKLSTCKH